MGLVSHNLFFPLPPRIAAMLFESMFWALVDILAFVCSVGWYAPDELW